MLSMQSNAKVAGALPQRVRVDRSVRAHLPVFLHLLELLDLERPKGAHHPGNDVSENRPTVSSVDAEIKPTVFRPGSGVWHTPATIASGAKLHNLTAVSTNDRSGNAQKFARGRFRTRNLEAKGVLDAHGRV